MSDLGDEWLRRVTASKVAAILGLSPWASPYSTWLRMKGLDPGDEGRGADDKARGHYLEDGVTRWWIDQHPGVAVHGTQTVFEREGWASATPDAWGELDGETFVFDAKTDASEDDWGVDPPAYYLAQLYWQMWCADVRVAYIAVLFGRPHLRFREWRVEWEDATAAGIVAVAREFFATLEADTPPPLDQSVATYDAIRRQHPDIDRDAEVEVPRDQAAEYVEADAALKAADDRARLAKSGVLALMGRARLARCGDLTLARRQPNRTGVSLVRVAKSIPPQPESETTR